MFGAKLQRLLKLLRFADFMCRRRDHEQVSDGDGDGDGVVMS